MTLPISVIVNTYQRAESLALTLSALERLDYEDFEVVVVNGPSTDATPEVLERYDGRIVVGRCLERNLSRSRNIGVRLAAGQVVAFIDDDAYPDPAWLDRIAEAYRDPEVAAAGGPVYNYTGSDIQAWRSFTDRYGNSSVEHARFVHPLGAMSVPFVPVVPYTIGTNSSFRRDVLIGIGGFDEHFEYYLEESDVCLRLVDLGYIVAQMDDGFVYHKFLPSWVRDRPDVVRDYRQILKSKAYFALKHGLAAGSFVDVCADIARFFSDRRAEVESNIENALLDPTDGERFERDAAEASDAAFAAWRAGPATRGTAWFGAPARDLSAFPRLRPEGGRLHLCLLSQEYPPVRVNGIGRVVHALATGLAAQGHLVHVVTRHEAPRTVDLEEGVWVHRVPVAPHVAPSDPVVPAHLWDYSATVFEEVCGIHDRRPLDVLQAPNWDSEGVAAIVDGRIPVVVGLYTPLATLIAHDPRFGSAVDGADPTLRQMVQLERYCYQAADGVLACGPSIVEEVEARYDISMRRESLALVPHGLSDLAATVAPRASGASPEVLFVGRLEPRKGADILLAAAPRLLAQHPSLVITLAGDDTLPTVSGASMRTDFEASASPEVTSRVRFTGPVDDAVLFELYSRSSIVVVPSRYESFGLMLLEAMMFAKPVVAADVGGMREIVVDEVTGLLVPPGDFEALALALDRLLDDPGLSHTLGEAGRRRYEEHFTHAGMVEGVVAFYRSLTGERTRVLGSVSV